MTRGRRRFLLFDPADALRRCVAASNTVGHAGGDLGAGIVRSRADGFLPSGARRGPTGYLTFEIDAHLTLVPIEVHRGIQNNPHQKHKDDANRHLDSFGHGQDTIATSILYGRKFGGNKKTGQSRLLMEDQCSGGLRPGRPAERFSRRGREIDGGFLSVKKNASEMPPCWMSESPARRSPARATSNRMVRKTSTEHPRFLPGCHFGTT